jgi:hypothetical protein
MPRSNPLGELEQENYRQRYTGRPQDSRQGYEQPVPGRLASPSRNVGSEKLIIPPIGFEDCIEHRAEKRSGAKERFYADIQHHARDRDSRNAELHRTADDIQRKQCIQYIADARNQPDETAKAVPKSAGKGESIVEPAREGFHISDARVHDFRAQRFALEFLTGERGDSWRQLQFYQAARHDSLIGRSAFL